MEKQPDSLHLDYAIARCLANMGRAIISIAPDEDGHGFAYTIGNDRKGLPELLVIGPSGPEVDPLLNQLSELLVYQGRAFEDGEVVKLQEVAQGVLIRNCGGKVRAEYTVQAGQFFGHEDYTIQQVIIPDPEGRYPGNENCDEPYCEVPILCTHVGYTDGAPTVLH